MKQKSHSGLKKRIKITATGKVIFKKSSRNHLLTNKSKRQKKVFKSGKPASHADMRYIKKLLT